MGQILRRALIEMLGARGLGFRGRWYYPHPTGVFPRDSSVRARTQPSTRSSKQVCGPQRLDKFFCQSLTPFEVSVGRVASRLLKVNLPRVKRLENMIKATSRKGQRRPRPTPDSLGFVSSGLADALARIEERAQEVRLSYLSHARDSAPASSQA